MRANPIMKIWGKAMRFKWGKTAMKCKWGKTMEFNKWGRKNTMKFKYEVKQWNLTNEVLKNYKSGNKNKEI